MPTCQLSRFQQSVSMFSFGLVYAITLPTCCFSSSTYRVWKVFPNPLLCGFYRTWEGKEVKLTFLLLSEWFGVQYTVAGETWREAHRILMDVLIALQLQWVLICSEPSLVVSECAFKMMVNLNRFDDLIGLVDVMFPVMVINYAYLRIQFNV